MSKSIITTQRGHSGSPWRIIPKEAQIGEICTLGPDSDDVVFGDVVYAIPGADTTAIGGEDSYMLTVEKPDAGNSTDDNVGACFAGVVQEIDGINAGKKGAVEFGPATLQAKVQLAGGATSLDAGDSLHVATAATGGDQVLVQPTGTGGEPHKIVAKVARSYTGFSANALVTVWVHFDGIYGFGSESSTA